MTKELRLGRIFGIEIAVDYTWFIIFLLIASGLATGSFTRFLPDLSPLMRWLIALVTALLFFASVLLHELAHSVVARRFGLPVSGITLFLFGGVSKLTAEPKSPRVEFVMALAGPLTSLALGGLFFLLAILVRPLDGGAFATIFRWLGFVNGFLAAFNLIPGFPLDGGRVLRAGLWHWSRNLSESTRIAATFGQGIGYLMIIGGFLTYFLGGDFGDLWLALIGWFLVNSARSSYQQMVLQDALGGIPVGAVMTTEVDTIPAEVILDHAVHDYIMARNHPAFPVVAGDGRLVGLLCIDDIRRVPREAWSHVTAGQVVAGLTTQHTIASTTSAWEALVRMSEGRCGRLLVMDGGQLRGIISRTDIMRITRSRLELGM